MLQKKKDTMQRTQTTVDGPVTGTLSQIVHGKFHIRSFGDQNVYSVQFRCKGFRTKVATVIFP
jgi:hypothetical protein